MFGLIDAVTTIVSVLHGIWTFSTGLFDLMRLSSLREALDEKNRTLRFALLALFFSLWLLLLSALSYAIWKLIT